MPTIQLENVNLYYDKGKPSEVWALKDVNIEINKSDYVAFFGPSGCGKTTLLYLISGMEVGRLESGKVLINGRDISQFSKKELAIFRQIGVGIVFQQFNLIPSITVLDNVAFPMAFLGISQTRRREEAMKLLIRLNIQQLANRYPHELSGGQQQRVGIARALANNAPIIIADEPLGNLDSENANNVMAFLKELNEKDGRTVIMVTHEAWSLKDVKKIFYMKDGIILKVEEPKAQTEVGKSLSSYYYKGLYPQHSKKELTAKSISYLFLRGYSLDEIKRFEFFLSQRLENKIDAEVFKQVLDRPFKDGGVGLWKKKAEKIAYKTEELISNKKEIEEIYKELEQNPAVPLVEEIANIRNWLLEGYKGKITGIQKMRIDEVIGERIRKIITSENFQKCLTFPKKQFGIGLSRRMAQRIIEKLESIIDQDVNLSSAQSISDNFAAKL
ncbi:MAG: ABC transporter ATP-binding protein [Patescibacteria group bacterium]|nr:ABC transporter ATP-binding protein [Patescibacteria group bacterium]